ncbi:aminotransferase class V-fold PLP-dependent enzyme [Jiangella gansuensis]|uniref:aminotransferase class V-fold PLP-dependent enzyme n=1 Tax=Jiangella gansuensis TaxID=281473 RepID=UPI0004BB0B78|nr:aminotransferase class V-fold PLP-dependent enzyme [Jiangella gansuensis]
MTVTDLPCTSAATVPSRTAPGSPAVPPELVRAPRQPLLPVVGADLRAPLAGGGECRYVNLDYAASAPALQAVADHVTEILPFYASVHRGAGYASQLSTRLYEDARETVARFVGARPDDVVVFTRNTTDSLNLLAGCVPGEVVVLDVEHHANLLPWQRGAHRVVEAAPTLERTLARLEAELARRPAALLAVTGASNVTGEQLPLGLLARLAHRNGARICVDAAQLAPHRRIDLVASQVDYVAFSGHKLYAPFGAGVLVGRRDWLDAGEPYLAGGGAVREVSVEETRWGPAPARHEAGSPNVVGAAALARACQVIEALPEGVVEQHESALRRRLIAGLSRIDGVRLHRIWPDSASVIGVVAFSVDGWDAAHVAAYLSAEHGIGVRDGRFCAHPLLARLGRPDGALRASFGLGSRAGDVDRLVAALERLVRDGAGHVPTVPGERLCDD